MLGLLFNRHRPFPRKSPRVAEGERVYAIGDIHGRFDLFNELVAMIGEHEHDLPKALVRLIVLGDFIDRGPQSRDVAEVLVRLKQNHGQIVILMGNHEAAMLASIDGDALAQQSWLDYGGRETLDSFGIAPPGEEEDPIDFAERMSAAIPDHLQTFMRELPLTVRSGDYFFCHAGVRPGVTLAKQTAEDLLWIREPFLGDRGYHGAVIVHGHSIVPHIDFRPNRIAVDTGAYRSGVLSALCLHEDRRWSLSTG